MSIVLIGNSPSSGSTFLADILDSTQFTACGPEVGIFTDSSVYKIGTDQWKGWGDECSCVYSSKASPNFDRFHNYGFSKSEFVSLQRNSSNFVEFSSKFRDRYLALRGKRSDSVMFEKTPNNISCLGEYLENSIEGNFIYLVRSPVFVYQSLLKRGFDPYIAATTWLVDAAKYVKYANDPRVILVKYENLAQRPFKTASQLIERVSGTSIDSSELQWNYENNQYRKYSSKKLDSWKIKAHGQRGNANLETVPDAIKSQIATLARMRIKKEYRDHFDLCDIDYNAALKVFGYDDQLVQNVSDARSYDGNYNYEFNLGISARYLLSRKYINSYRYRNRNRRPLGFSCAMKPVV